MNFLAHVFLGDSDPAAIVGQLCGDFVRGSRLTHFPRPIQTAIRQHRAVDAFTDRHALNVAARGLFEKPYRRFAGIAIDVIYDHFLACDWDHYCETPLDEYVELVHRSLAAHDHVLPDRLQQLAPYLKSEKILQNNRSRSHIELTLQRLSRRRSSMLPLASMAPIMWHHEGNLKQTFDQFFPQLIEFSKGEHKGL